MTVVLLSFCCCRHLRSVFGDQVTINAIENSASVASLVLTTECLVAEIPVKLTEQQERAQYDAMGGGDYM